ncbi:hypothetical protein HH212_05510 [Massilia forsythiae]|uniref:Uncharacterized protein n=1 Tax=Massilia forsythiae TaxID=2728020 RepID=A0A7Z2ZRI8_9BURK|nr:hypothetical protein [Massilia forsythiae]QJD99547.1 hypothetical protein HH212_05510 [Massilia forsythiae]
MIAIDKPSSRPRGRFILQHLAAVVLGGILGYVLGLHPLALLIAVAPLLAVRGAGRRDRTTFMISVALALLLVVCAVGLSLLLVVFSLGRGNWR